MHAACDRSLVIWLASSDPTSISAVENRGNASSGLGAGVSFVTERVSSLVVPAAIWGSRFASRAAAVTENVCLRIVQARPFHIIFILTRVIKKLNGLKTS